MQSLTTTKKIINFIWNFYNHKTDVAYQIIKNEYKEIKVIKFRILDKVP